MSPSLIICPVCRGYGSFDGEDYCQECDGAGRIPDRRRRGPRHDHTHDWLAVTVALVATAILAATIGYQIGQAGASRPALDSGRASGTLPDTPARTGASRPSGSPAASVGPAAASASAGTLPRGSQQIGVTNRSSRGVASGGPGLQEAASAQTHSGPFRHLQGRASWFASFGPGHYAAAGPRLRQLLGGADRWRGRIVRVCRSHFSALRCHRSGVPVRLVDWCQCFRGTRRERVIDLSFAAFDRLGDPWRDGVIRVVVTR